MRASAFVPTSLADEPEQVSIYELLQGKYEEYIQSVREKNIPNILSLLTSDFVWTLEDGSCYDRLQTEGLLQEQFQMMDSLEHMSITLLEFSADETEATVVLREDSKGVSKDINASRFTTVETIKEIWKKTPEGWQIKTARVLQSRTLSMPMAVAS